MVYNADKFLFHIIVINMKLMLLHICVYVYFNSNQRCLKMLKKLQAKNVRIHMYIQLHGLMYVHMKQIIYYVATYVYVHTQFTNIMKAFEVHSCPSLQRIMPFNMYLLKSCTQLDYKCIYYITVERRDIQKVIFTCKWLVARQCQPYKCLEANAEDRGYETAKRVLKDDMAM